MYPSGEGRLAEWGALLRTPLMDSDRRSAQVVRLADHARKRRGRHALDAAVTSRSLVISRTHPTVCE